MPAVCVTQAASYADSSEGMPLPLRRRQLSRLAFGAGHMSTMT
ncbi:hypothetical protein CT19431_MP130251 [Cupriavidus taiwanensis]|nr:hypothetical protein CT19431_MP130251 [Cupriavidus taiwanensis]